MKLTLELLIPVLRVLIPPIIAAWQRARETNPTPSVDDVINEFMVNGDAILAEGAAARAEIEGRGNG